MPVLHFEDEEGSRERQTVPDGFLGPLPLRIGTQINCRGIEHRIVSLGIDNGEQHIFAEPVMPNNRYTRNLDSWNRIQQENAARRHNDALRIQMERMERGPVTLYYNPAVNPHWREVGIGVTAQPDYTLDADITVQQVQFPEACIGSWVRINGRDYNVGINARVVLNDEAYLRPEQRLTRGAVAYGITPGIGERDFTVTLDSGMYYTHPEGRNERYSVGADAIDGMDTHVIRHTYNEEPTRYTGQGLRQQIPDSRRLEHTLTAEYLDRLLGGITMVSNTEPENIYYQGTVTPGTFYDKYFKLGTKKVKPEPPKAVSENFTPGDTADDFPF